MGADLFVAICPVPIIVAGDDVAPETPIGLAKDELRRRIDAIDDERLCVAVSEAGYGYEYEDGDTPSETAALIRADLRQDEVLSCLFDDMRDTTWVSVGGRFYVAAGGMSWGDEPSDAYKWICIFAELGITLEPVRLGAAATRPLRIETSGITIELGPPRGETPGAYAGGRIVASAVRDPGGQPDEALDAIEALVLAHAVAGVDVTTPAYQEGLETALDAVANYLA